MPGGWFPRVLHHVHTTRAVIPVHLYGNVTDMDAARAVAEHHRIAIFEDAAGAIASEFRGRNGGSMGDTGVISFHGSKTLATGESGTVVTNSGELLEGILFLRDHGRAPGDCYFSTPICPTLGDAEMGDEGVEVVYQISLAYEPASAASVHWDGPAFNIDWPVDQPFLSERDAAFPDFQR